VQWGEKGGTINDTQEIRRDHSGRRNVDWRRGILRWGADAAPPAGPPPDGQPGPLPPFDAARLKADLGKSLDKLMAEKVINSKEKEVILKYYDPFFAKVDGSDPRKMMDELKTLEQEKKDPLSLLVNDRKINKKQAKAIKEVFPPRPPQPRGEKSGHKPPPSFSGNYEKMRPSDHELAMRNKLRPGFRSLPEPGGLRPEMNFRYKLDILVIAGAITENQEEAILRKLWETFDPGEMRKYSPGPETDRFLSSLQALAEEGVLNKEQAEVVGKVLMLPAPGERY
jgi:hypothetical protein